MNISDKFNFGKYKGLSILEVYQGTNRVSSFFIRIYLKKRLNEFQMGPEEILNQVLNFEISETILRATPISKEFFGNYSDSISRIFDTPNDSYQSYLNNKSLGDFLYYSKINNEIIPQICNGNPEYLNSCINNIDNFFIDPESLKKMQELSVFKLSKIQVSHVIDDFYSWNAVIENSNYTFPIKTVELNEKKNNYWQDILKRESEWEEDCSYNLSYMDWVDDKLGKNPYDYSDSDYS